MDGGWLHRWRWRRRGAWLWPTFVAMAILDGLLVHALPLAGSTQTIAGGIVFAMLANLLAVLLLSRPLGMLLRRHRTDMPPAVARNYGGTFAVCAVSALLLVIGLAHRPTIVAQQHALDDAIVRAEAFIGDRAPAQFRANMRNTDTYVINPGDLYRTCVANRAGTLSYCVIVRSKLPLAESVVPDGSEPNSTFAQGAN